MNACGRRRFVLSPKRETNHKGSQVSLFHPGTTKSFTLPPIGPVKAKQERLENWRTPPKWAGII